MSPCLNGGKEMSENRITEYFLICRSSCQERPKQCVPLLELIDM